MKKIVISGATSMLGTALMEVAVRNDVEVFAIVRPNTKRIGRIIDSPKVHIIYSSLDNLKSVETLTYDCDVFYHFAWAGTSKTERNNPLVQNENITYTLDAVELASKMGCKRFVGAGSQAEYGPVNEVIDENTKYNPVTPYGIAKYAAGILSKKLCEEKGMDHVWGRVFSVYGPHDNDGTMINHVLNCWKTGETAHLSSGMQYWNYLYESDAGEYFYRLGKDNVSSGTYFVANPKSVILKEYVEIMMRVYGDGANVVFAPCSEKHPPGLNVNAEKTLSIIDYKAVVGFEDGIKRIIEDERHV